MKQIKLKIPSKLEHQLAEFIFLKATLLLSYSESGFFENEIVAIIMLPESNIEDFQNSQFKNFIVK